MSIKKTSLPPSNGADSINRLSSKEEIKDGKIEKTFEAALAEVAGQIEGASVSSNINSQTHIALRQIASSLNLNSSDEAMSAVRQSAHFIVNSRLEEKLRETDQGKKITDDLTEFISNDPLIYRKILGILKSLK